MLRHTNSAHALGTAILLAGLAACGGGEEENMENAASDDAAPQNMTASAPEIREEETTGPVSPETVTPNTDISDTGMTAGVQERGAPLDGPQLTGLLSDGEWVYKDADPAALFGPADSEALFSLWCNADSATLTVQRTGEIAPQQQIAIELVSDTASAQVYATPADGPMPLLEGSLDLDSTFLTELPQATRFAVTTVGLEKLLLPVEEPIGRMIEECRSRAG